MAEALLGVVLQNLNSFLHNELATFYGVHQEIQRLSETLPLVLAVIEDAEQKEITSPPIRLWLQQLKDAAHVLDDILDEYSIRSLQRNSGSASQVQHCLSLSPFKPNNIWFRYDIGKRLKDISERLDRIAHDRKNYILIEHEGRRERPTQVPEWRQTSSVIAQPQIYGRDGDKKKIVEFLVRKAHHSSSLSVYPIVGLGGLGKTTLAQMVFNDPKVSKHFTLKIWVCVSDDFSVIRILQSIMESITSQKCEPLNLDTMQKIVQERLQSVRYLLVLDDVWNKNQEQWDKLKCVLECGSNGASVLVTTRDLEVASIMKTVPACHCLSLLSEDDCWLLFKQRAFTNDEDASAELVAIGKEIVRKCGGVPLAAKALGSLMRSKSGEKQWLEVKESELWNLPDETILPALRLSYFNLTPTLRRCFAFCAMFPKDEVINKEELIHLWIANGLISSSRENLDNIEDVGNEIWNELEHKSFFQEVVIDDDGCIRFKMHDLVHDLAQSVMGKECFVINNGDTTNSSRSIHHIGYNCVKVNSNHRVLKNIESLRTLFNLDSYSEMNFAKLRTHYSLRVLSGPSPKPPLFCYLIHLRYLAMHNLHVVTIPSSICGLRKLEILKLTFCFNLRHLPKGLTTHLQNLRHFIIDGCLLLSCMPPSIGKLSRLRTLSLFIVRSEAGHSLAELHGLNLRQRELSIKGLEHVGSVAEAKGVNLIGIKELRVLSLSWVDRESEIKAQGVDAEQVIEALQPDSNLKKLVVCEYKGSHFPSWMKDVSCISNLVSLELNQCKNCVQIPALGKLPSLKKLDIWGMHCVQYMDEDECYDGVEVKAFISLKTLTLGSMPNLERLLKREGGEMFPRLLKLVIVNCPKLTLACLPSVEDLTIDGCEEELLMSISSLRGLESLQIEKCPKLKELPTQLMSLHALRKLGIWLCDELECIPEQVMEGLRSLETCGICDCRALKCLPEAIQHLTSLERLSIHGCPIVEERCKEATGEDWHKIQHIPHKTFGW